MNFMDQAVTLDETPSRKWSPQQEAIFDEIKEPSSAILVQACAGSGKTTTIVEGMRHGGGRPVFLAFNKSIQEELAKRIPLGEAKTLNSLGFGACRRKMGSVQLDVKKNSIHLQKAWEEIGLNSDQMKQHGFSASRMMGVAKNLAIGCPGYNTPDTKTFEDIAEAYWFTFPEEIKDSILLAVKTAFIESIKDMKVIDFDDQLYYPVYYNWELPSFSDAFVDECQDLSPIQHALIQKLGNNGTRIVAVGDRYQAIYGFRGASHSSMDELKDMFRMTELPLSTTYRCPQLVVAEAQKYCPTIFAREGAPLGDVASVLHDPNLWTTTDTLILCRNNAPLFRAIMRHVRAKEPVRVLSNFLDQLSGFIKSFKTSSCNQLRAKLDNWYERERAKAEEDEAWGKLSGIEDRYETLCVLMQGLDGTGELLDLLQSLSKGTRGPLFSTIHKAKGLEAPHIHLLRPDLLPSKWAFGESAQRQEDNLSYVGVTRAQETFTYGAVKE
jgi:superfamily I DNA/RNA helicase